MKPKIFIGLIPVIYLVSWTCAYAIFLEGDFKYFFQYFYHSWSGPGELAAFIQWTAMIVTGLFIIIGSAVLLLKKYVNREKESLRR